MRWCDVNRFQRATDFDEAAPSIAVPFTASMWGSLAAFGARTGATEKKLYGVKGNSFVAIVEFGYPASNPTRRRPVVGSITINAGVECPPLFRDGRRIV